MRESEKKMERDGIKFFFIEEVLRERSGWRRKSEKSGGWNGAVLWT